VNNNREERIARVIETLTDILVMENAETFYSDDYHISENVEKPYYVLCHWNLGSNGFFADKEDVIERMRDILDRPEGEHYWLEVIDVDTGETIKPIIKDIEFEEDHEVFYSNSD
jgi:hypothetical protein